MADVISNTSPFQYLHQIRQLDLLPALCGKIVVPDAVLEELAVGRRSALDLPDPARLTWVTIRSPISAPVLSLVSDLGRGEASVLALALETPGATALLDDGLARKVARARGIPVVGTLGVLLRAKAKKLIEQVGPLMDQLQARGFRLDSATRTAILEMAGEADGQ